MNTVTAYGNGFVEINAVRFEHAIAFAPEGEITRWAAQRPTDISTELLLAAARLSLAPVDPMAFLDSTTEQGPTVIGERPEVLLVGTGTLQVLLGHHITGPILRLGIGVECMSTQAATRTYNILMAEGRRVIAALLLEND